MRIGTTPQVRETEGREVASEFEQLKRSIHRELLTRTEFSVLESMSPEDLTDRIEYLTIQLAQEQEISLSQRARREIQRQVGYEVLGYGPIQTLLDDPEITEIMVNGPHRVFVERYGKIEETDIRFVDDNHVMRIIEKIISPLGRRLDEAVPTVDARLPDGSRVNAIIPPLSLTGPCLTIRKFAEEAYTADDLVRFGTMTEWMSQFLAACVRSRLNIMVSGGTGTGKTTTLNVLSSFLPDEERIVTIEDAAELQLQQNHVITLETRPPNIEGKGEITIRQLVRNALRMRPDRIIIGEVRGGEALDMLQAMNTGHDGSISTVHANTARDALTRIETMAMMAGMDLPSRVLREQIAAAIDLIIQQSRLRDGTRRITSITEVQRMEGETIVMEDLFVFRRERVDAEGRVLGTFTPTGVRPLFMDILEADGEELAPEAFIPVS